MTFVDITVVPVARDKKSEYVEFSKRMADVYRDHGATKITDYWQSETPSDQSEFHADGLDYAAGELHGLAQTVGASEGEAVVVTITEWPSQEARDRGTVAATEDPRVTATLNEPPVFDGSRLVADTFEKIEY